MPLGIVNDQEFEQEINNSSVDSNNYDKPRASNPTTVITSDSLPEIEILPSVGRTPEVSNVPQSLRKILGEEVAVNGLRSARQLADSLGGISQPTLSTYGRGEVSPNGKNDQDNDLTNYINGRKGKITKKALHKINLALSLMDETKLMGCDAKELSSVAKDMSVVVKQMEPTVKEEEKKDPVQFHFYSPVIKQENHYETVTAKDNY